MQGEERFFEFSSNFIDIKIICQPSIAKMWKQSGTPAIPLMRHRP
jgi:hypothetical protein